MVVLKVLLREETHLWIKERAVSEGLTMSALIRQMLMRAQSRETAALLGNGAPRA